MRAPIGRRTNGGLSDAAPSSASRCTEASDAERRAILLRAMLGLALLVLALVLIGAPASAQFYKGKTLTLLVNYGVGGNADTEARIYQRYLPKYIAGNPTVII